jgi:hypothetical protein
MYFLEFDRTIARQMRALPGSLGLSGAPEDAFREDEVHFGDGADIRTTGDEENALYYMLRQRRIE